MRITTGSPQPRDGQIPILSTSIQPSPAAHADLPHQSAGSDSFRKDFLPLLILLLLKTPENEGMLKGAGPAANVIPMLHIFLPVVVPPAEQLTRSQNLTTELPTAAR